MAPKFKGGGQVGSMKKLRQSLKKGSGSSIWIKRVPQNGSLMVRFATEPEDWYGYYEHYQQGASYYPCVEDDCPGCSSDERRSFRYLANVLDIDNDRIIPLKLPKDLANRLTLSYDKYGTMMDRDYELMSSGEGLDTTYDRDAEAPTKRNMSKYELLDLEEILSQAWDDVFGGGDDDDDKPSSKSSSRTAKPKSGKALPGRKKGFLDDDDDEDLDDEDELDDDEEDDAPTDAELRTMPGVELKKYAISVGAPAAKVKALKNRGELITLIKKHRD